MACTGRYAEAWEFAAFWCVGSKVVGVDNGGGAAVAALTDTTANFIEDGIRANVGMVLYNTTTGLSGQVTAVTTSTLTATGVTWTDGDAYRIVPIDGDEISTIEVYLDIAAGDIHAAMYQSGMCDCSLASWATGLLSKLNIIEAAAFYQCPCAKPNISDEMRGRYLDWCSTQLEAIRTSHLELCAGATGADFPAIGWAEVGWTPFATAQIITNYEDRNS